MESSEITLLPNSTETNKPIDKSKTFIIDTAFFIKLRTLETQNKYITTKFVIEEIRDEKAREFYELNKDFILIQNPSTKAMKFITSFAKKSNDLFNLSIPDLSVIALAFEQNQENFKLVTPMRIDPIDYKVIKKEYKKQKKVKPEVDEDGFIIVQSGKKEEVEDEENNLWGEFGDDMGWINSENVEEKLSKFKPYEEVSKSSNELDAGCYIISDDYTVQNVCLKIGIGIVSIAGMAVKRVKNFLFKCYSCYKFNFDTSILFCKECGYNTLMKIGFTVNEQGEVTIFDKDAELRNRGTQFDLPKPTLGKKATVYILAEDQLPKQKKDFDIESHLEKILENYDQYKDLYKAKKQENHDGQSSKNYEWGYPKQNPNIPKKYYGKKTKK